MIILYYRQTPDELTLFKLFSQLEILLSLISPFKFQKLNVAMEKSWNRMTAKRCAYLMAVAAANKLHEVWVTPNPELLYCYLFQYMPYIAKL